MDLLPYDYSRCVGHRQYVAGQFPLERLNPACEHCRRREPGHPERHAYLAPDVAGLAAGGCLNFIPPAKD